MTGPCSLTKLTVYLARPLSRSFRRLCVDHPEVLLMRLEAKTETRRQQQRCPPVPPDVVFRRLAVDVAAPRREPGRRSASCRQPGPRVAVTGRGRPAAGARCYRRPSAATAARRSLPGEVGGMAVAEVAAATPLAHGPAVGGDSKVGVISGIRRVTRVDETTAGV